MGRDGFARRSCAVTSLTPFSLLVPSWPVRRLDERGRSPTPAYVAGRGSPFNGGSPWLAEAVGAGQDPAEEGVVITAGRLRVRQAEQVAVRPAIALLILDHLAGQFVGGAVDIQSDPVAADRGPNRAAIDILGEVEQCVPMRQTFARL